LREQWRALLVEVCDDRLPRTRLRDILDLLLYDGEDVRRCDLLPPSNPETSNSPVLTPVERLLLFVTIAFGRLYPELKEARDDQTSNPKYVRCFRCINNLRRLVHLALNATPARAFSVIDKLRLYVQWSSFTYWYTQVHPIQSFRSAGREFSLSQLTRLEERLEELPGADPEIESLRAQCLYRRAVGAARIRHESAKAAACLTKLLTMSSRALQPGLYFHAARQVLRLPLNCQRAVLRDCRMALATAFAFAPEGRTLDRIGIGYLLAQDASLRGAGELASRTIAQMEQLIGSEYHCSEDETTVWRVNWLRSRVKAQLDSQQSSNRGVAEMQQLVLTFGALAEVDVLNTYELLRKRKPNETFVTRLYKDVSQSWIGRVLSADQPVISSSFLDNLSTALEEYRNDPEVLSVARAGCVCRLLAARGKERIDDVFEEYERLMAFTVAAGDWQSLIDQLRTKGHHKFLQKVGFDYEGERLDGLGSYFERMFGLQATEIRDSPALIDRLLFGKEILSADLRLALDSIENSWRKNYTPDGIDGTIEEWAAACAAAASHGEFTPNHPDPLVRKFFADCGTVLAFENQMEQGERVLDPTGIWTAMAWSALHFCRILRKVGRGSAAIETVEKLSHREWREKGAGWADKAIQSAKQQDRPASLYRALDVRKRLELENRKKQNRRLIQELTNDMLNIDEVRLKTTHYSSRRNRAVVRAERSLCEVVGPWCARFQTAVPVNSDLEVQHHFALLQRLKSFNYGQLANGNSKMEDANRSQENIADQVLGEQSAPDVFERVDVYSRAEILSPSRARQLYLHLREQRAAILDFVTHPGSASSDWKVAIGNRWGTVCFVVKAGPSGLVIRPIFLEIPEALIRLVVDGSSGSDSEVDQSGLSTDLVYWPGSPENNKSEILKTFSDRLFPESLLQELDGCRRLYLCPHRHLFQVPLHAFPLENPLFLSFDTSYAIKTTHIADLLEGPQVRSIAPTSRWMLVDNQALGAEGFRIDSWLKNGNDWGSPGLGAEDLMRRAAMADQAVVCCHGQLDDARPGRTRFRLWGGGRLVADDIHRLTGTIAAAHQATAKLGSTDWVIAACNAGGARVAMRTAPGLALSLVTSGAARVTSCLFRVQPKVATRFLNFFLTASGAGHHAPFTAAIRGLYNQGKRDGRERAGWAEAASFTSYGLLISDGALRAASGS